MTKVIYHATMSLDGYVAGPGGDMSWVRGFAGGPNEPVDRLLDRIGALLIGGGTFHGTPAVTAARDTDTRPASSEEGTPYGGAWRGPMVVHTHEGDPAPVEGYEKIGGDIRAAAGHAIERAAGGDVAVLGPTTAARLLMAGMLDEVLLHVAPVLLGGSVRALSLPADRPYRLTEVERSFAGDVTNLWYRVDRG
ncbi:riboflavin biosynthesis pyrimidine reductase [Mumia flava]|uniref:Riboflavin biosynthesis pyrimidine reductase n=1 Tax=Mumia flava TaxID=1348852 RepID=A0A0B2BQC6_9ACTN|nr:dihydrofolate reductase family protein [Mumia flava]PJJ58086.1 riboflavin biosynthesis pyrimidine reductase [Mumia flava]